MNAQLSVSEILDRASLLKAADFESLFKKMAVLYANRRTPSTVPKEESEILEKINQGFPTEKWGRLQFLDWKMESDVLDEREAEESLQLATEYENYTVWRLQMLTKLADLRKVSLEEVMAQLGMKPLAHG